MNPKWPFFARACLCGWLLWLPDSSPAVEATGASPDHLIHVWRSEDGLPHNAILSLAQTPDGYIWAGTRSGGLARFDGVRFVSFNPQNTPELRDVEIEKLIVDATGTMWILTGNESLTTYRAGRFTLVQVEHPLPRWHPAALLGLFTNNAVFLDRNSRIFSLPLSGPTNTATKLSADLLPTSQPPAYRQDAQGQAWYLGPNRNLLAFNGQTFSKFPRAEVPFRDALEDLAVDRYKNLWLAGGRHVAMMQNGTFVDQTPTNGPAPRTIRRLVPAGSDSLWVCETDRLRRLQNKRWVAAAPAGLKLPERTGNAVSVFGDHAGGLWCLSYGEGLLHVQPDGRATMLTEADGLPSRAVTSWLEDDEGDIWVGTIDAGLARIRPRQFQVFGAAQGLPGEAVQSVCEDANGAIWAGMVSGQLAKRVGNRFEIVPLKVPNPDKAASVIVCPAANGSMWVGGQRVGLLHLKPQAGSDHYVQTNVSNNSLRLLMRDQAGRVWFGGGHGLSVLQDGKIRMIGPQNGFKKGIGIGTLAEDSVGVVWIGSGLGQLSQYRDRHFRSFQSPPDWPPTRFSAMQAESNGVVWIGTLGDGLIRFENGAFRRITSAQGLPDDFITQLLDDEQGHLWAGTYSGIFRVDKTALNAVARDDSQRVVCWKFGWYDGLPTVECSGGFFQPASWRAHDGRLWFATLKGLVSVDPSQVKAFRRSPPVSIEELRVDGIPRNFEPDSPPAKAGTLAPPLQIEPGRHSLQIRYTAFNYTAPDDIHFRWKLDGSDPNWHEAGGDRVISFAPLPPGNYTFRVRAANSSGLWNETGAALPFTVLPHVWETWWFKLAAGTGILVILMLGASLSIRRRYHRRLEQQRELEGERSRIARDLHDDLGTNLTQIALLSALVSRENTPAGEILELARQIRAKSRQMASSLNEIVWAVNPRNDSLNDVLEYFGSFAVEFLNAAAIRCRLDLPEQISDYRLSAEIRHNLYLAFKEALNNAAKYSAGTEITVIARETPDEVILSVRDNGKGWASAPQPGRGNGLRNMRERMQKIGGRCEIDSQAEKGTTVNFHLAK